MGSFPKFYLSSHKQSVCFLLACTAILSGCKKTNPPAEDLPQVVIELPLIQDVPVWQEWIGTLTGVVNASILSQASGYVQSQDYENGAFVKKGTVLFHIDLSIYKDQLNQAQARLSQAQAQWKQADYNRNLYKPLAVENVVSKQKYEDAVLSAQAAEADILAAQAAVNLASRNLSYTTIVAPVDGIADIADVQVGDLVSPSGKIMTRVSSIDPIRIEFSVTEDQWLKGKTSDQNGILQQGSELAVFLSNGDIYPFKANVTAVARAFGADTGTIGIQATVKNENFLLRPGMFVKVKSLVDTKENAITVPQKAVYSTQGRFFIVVVERGDSPRIVPVSTGVLVGANQVVEPLEPGALSPQSHVVVDGVMEAMMASSRGIQVKEVIAEKQ